MFSTGFTMSPETQAEPANGETLEWMKKLAKEKNAVVCGSVSVSENGAYLNRLYWTDPAGHASEYDKRHLFRMGKEHEHYQAGTQKLIQKTNGFSVCPLVCYDLRFPVWSRNKLVSQKQETLVYEYDLLVYVANWPTVRTYAWKQLLIARAIENQCYVAAVNRVGTDGNGVDHQGASMIISPQGEILAETNPDQEQLLFYELDFAALQSFRSKFPAALDADEFNLLL
jgi:predicted amidohydrolase